MLESAETWLRYAEEDLKAAELLFKSGFHRHALFWVEQASEKILKVFIVDVLRAKDLAPKFADVISYYMMYAVSDEDRKELERLYKEVTRLSDPKSYQHICKEKHIERVMLFFDMLSKAPMLPPMKEILRGLSDIPKKISKERYRRAFREAEKLVGEAVSSVQVPPIPSCREFNASCIVQILHSIEEREDRVREVILNAARKELERHKGDELAEEAVKDVCYLYTSFSDSLAVAPYLTLHTYLCQFFEATRYPEGEIPRDVVESLPQIICLLRKNLERVMRLVQSSNY
ncbi:MAG: hypothetical protein DRO12_06720 [Thermoprotei archaeon]|nr:MAG: hypothetical protein DRO12_06720 [Thermoprotei archaeon]